MKILVQWTTKTAQDWTEINAEFWENTPERADPTGINGQLDDATGWVHAICVQGVTFNGYDHYSVEHLPGRRRFPSRRKIPNRCRMPMYGPSAIRSRPSETMFASRPVGFCAL